ncbi:MAG TPA: transglycosylase domain-containing protein [Sphingomonas sp.]|jgi:penicillin-binding protein 1A|uniref:penicillin-binding protein 1A n=1 Tax=Sphingomonas sp. TaxID=28214 RepID=UPI002ED886E5
MASHTPPIARPPLHRFARRAATLLRSAWTHRWVRWLAALAALGLISLLALIVAVGRGLPSVDSLRSYEQPLPTNVRAGDGAPVHAYARERRVELSYAEYPSLLVGAFLAAEDRTFFEHGGVDYPGIVSALISNLRNDGRPIGASTITQQVAKNLLLTNEVSYIRKAREAILAYRIEDALSKEQILELYLNGIPLGRRSFGVQAAARAYFGKDVGQLAVHEAAFLAILPKAPETYGRARNADRAIARRNFVLSEMQRNGFITPAQRADAAARPLGLIASQTARLDPVGGYFVEEVRRQLVDRYGENSENGPYSVYAGGLWVRTSLDPRLQGYAQEALRDGLLRYDRGRGWSGPIKQLDIDGGDWLQALVGTNIALDHKDWRAAIAIARAGAAWEIGFANGQTGTLPAYAAQIPVRGQGGTAFAALKAGDVIAVAPEGGAWSLRSIPRVSGGFVVEEPATGRILAMQGGFDSRLQSFNRATQALRQPGSTIKPIVYSAALERGMTPSSIIVDGPFCVYQGARLGQKCFRNFDGGGSGPHTMRWGIEQSRNLMTVRAASQVGMPHVVDTMKRMGLGSYPPFLANALGAGETTVARIVNAYAILANGGRGNAPTVIDFVQDRRGKVILPERWRPCDGCNAPDWNGRAMPRPPSRQRQVIDAQTAFQMVHITEGVIQRGTATTLRDLDRPIFGKTGTTTGPTDVWFIGGTPQFVGGLYVGYDQPQNLGGVQGGTFAAPIFKQFAVKAYEGLEKKVFRAPPGIRMVRVDRGSGRPVYGVWPTGTDPKPAVIWEAFKPQAEERRARRRTGPAAAPTARPTAGPKRVERAQDSDFLQRQGGIY